MKQMRTEQAPGWGLGWAIQADGLFSHDGSSGTSAWADPASGTVCVVFCQIQDKKVTDALQVLLGSQYVNDFDFNNRAYRVYVQADQRFRADPSNLRQYYARSATGQMVALDSVVSGFTFAGPGVSVGFALIAVAASGPGC